MDIRANRLKKLSRLNGASKYLEIGLARGKTFLAVDIPYKVGVDPKLRLPRHAHDKNNTFLFEMTSDLFFATTAEDHGPFDIIYLDGLHTFEQTFRDFCASLRHSHENTIWLIDDTNPTDWLSAHPNYLFVKRFRKALRIRKRDWMGDTYKIVFAIHDFFPQFSYATFSGHSQTVVWNEVRRNFLPTWNSLKSISAISFRKSRNYLDSHLNFLDDEAIYSLVSRI